VYCWPALLLSLVFNGIKCSRLKKRPKRHLFSVTVAEARRATDATPTLGSRSPGAGCIGELVAIWSMAAFAWSMPAAVASSWRSLSAPQAAAEGAVLRCSHTALDRRRSSPRLELVVYHARKPRRAPFSVVPTPRWTAVVQSHRPFVAWRARRPPHRQPRKAPSPLPPHHAGPRSFRAVGRSSLLPSTSSPSSR
jgi:hypothetical protein